MAFRDYRSVDDVIRRHHVRTVRRRVVEPAADAPPFSDYFRGEFDLSLQFLSPGRSEIGSGEIILFPILREVWKTYREDLSLFSHEELRADDDLCGFPDYFVCPVSEYGRIPTPPYLLVVEAKLDDFERAWGQCLAAMLAAQKQAEIPNDVYGLTSNGKVWEFGVLRGREFAHDPLPLGVADLQGLGRSLHAVFRACQDAAKRTPVAAL